jgi:pimeloyl-ACP methyl ester carboxylesterase
MAQIVRHGESIGRWHLKVEHGLAVILDRVEEIDGLLSICRFVPTPQRPLRGVFEVLNSRDLDLDRWADHLRDTLDLEQGGDRRGYDPRFAENFGERRTPHATLIDALSLARILWAESAREGSNLNLVLVLASPEAAAQGIAPEVSGSAVGLAFEYGSLTEKLFKLPLKVTAFGVCLVLGEGVNPAARTDTFVDRLRGAADYAGTAYQLPRIDQVQKSEVGNRALVVLVHGLMGTDVGTFGELENQLFEVQWNRRRKDPSEQFLIVGYPHDSVMKSIKVNAEELLEQLEGLGRPRTVFACHSRGGLVARAAAAINGTKNVKTQLLGAVTFGTPHTGASLAESPVKLSLSVLLWRALGQGGSAVDTLADLLCCYATDDKLIGVVGMKPRRDGTEFIATLQSDEDKLDQELRLNMLRYGGIATPTGITKWLVKRLIGDKKHDLVVETDSTLPAARPGKNEDPLENVDHFSYFKNKWAVNDAKDFVLGQF